MTPRSPGRGERGAAVVESSLVMVVVLFVFLACLQLGLALHIRNTLIACASEGARMGARVGSDPQAGAARTRELVTQEISGRFAQDVTAYVGSSGGVQVVTVRVRAPLPVLGPFGPAGSLDVTGRAFLERQ